MRVEIRENGQLEIHLSDPSSAVQRAAIQTLAQAVEKGQSIRVEKTESGIALVTESH